MLSYFRGRFNIKGLYFLDEPEAALSPSSQVKFLNLLQQLAATGRAQFIIATHSAILMALPQAQIYSFNSSYVKEVAYEETEHYKVYKQFFTDRSSFIEAVPGKVGESKSDTMFAFEIQNIIQN
jgi:predicted ATPase